MIHTPLFVVGIGEALFDLFPDHRVLGGAPLNVAFHARQLLKPWRGEARAVSCVGADDAGKQIVQQVLNWSPASKLQVDHDHPTGTVIVTPHGNEVEYEIIREVAWDYLLWTEEIGELASQCGAVSFGTLAQRSPVSRETILRFVAEANQAIRLFDVNLRQAFFSSESIERSCSLANLVKCNSTELPQIYRMFFESDSSTPEAQAEQLRLRFNLDAWIVTRGKDGTQAITRSGIFDADPVAYPLAENADPVGAGDGCTAAILVGLLLGKSWNEILSLANRVGAWIASQPGATPELPKSIHGY